MFKLLVNYPSAQEESDILRLFVEGKDNRQLDSFHLQSILSADDIRVIQQSLVDVIIEPAVIDYITAIVQRTRVWHAVEVGASPRASVNLLLASRAMAAIRGRDFVMPDDIKELAPWVLRHRIRLDPDAEIEGLSPDDVINAILDAIEAPK